MSRLRLKVSGLSRYSFQPPAWDQGLTFAGANRRQYPKLETTMDPKDLPSMEKLELRPVFGLTQGLPAADLETLTVDAIRKHRQLVERADALYQALPGDYQAGRATGGAQHLEFIEASIEMHAQMSALNTLLAILGHIPKVSVN